METFLFVLLLILKILGITLLVILGIVLLLVCLILFVPVRYSGEGSFIDNKPKFRAKASYLLHILTVSFDIEDGDKLRIKLFCFRLNKKKQEKEEVFSDEPAKESGSQPVVENIAEKESEEKIEDLSEEIKEEKAETPEEKPDETTSEAPKEAPSGHKFTKKKKEKKEKSTKSPGIYDKIKGYMEKLKRDEVRESLALCKKQIGIVLKSVLPKRGDINGSVGFDDPSTTGTVCMIIGIISPWTYKHLHVTGDFENAKIELSGNFKGRIYGVVLLTVFLRVFFNKNVRKAIKLFKEE